MEMVETNTGGSDAEHVGRPVVEVRIELNLDVVRLITIVATAHRSLDPGPAVHTRSDPERGVVIDEPNFQMIGRLRSLNRLSLLEISDRYCPLPGFVVKPAIEPD